MSGCERARPWWRGVCALRRERDGQRRKGCSSLPLPLCASLGGPVHTSRVCEEVFPRETKSETMACLPFRASSFHFDFFRTMTVSLFPVVPAPHDARAILSDLIEAEAEAGPLPAVACACAYRAVAWMSEVS